MTETHPEQQTPQQRYDAGDRVVPPGADMLDDLTVAELDTVSRQLKVDVIEAVGGKAGMRWAALSRVAWLWARRRDMSAQLTPFTEMTATQLGRLLGLDDDDAPAGDDDDENPTEPAHA